MPPRLLPHPVAVLLARSMVVLPHRCVWVCLSFFVGVSIVLLLRVELQLLTVPFFSTPRRRRADLLLAPSRSPQVLCTQALYALRLSLSLSFRCLGNHGRKAGGTTVFFLPLCVYVLMCV